MIVIVRTILAMKGVQSVKLSQRVRLSTTRSWDFLGLTSERSSELLRKAKSGDGMIIGVIDSGARDFFFKSNSIQTNHSAVY